MGQVRHPTDSTSGALTVSPVLWCDSIVGAAGSLRTTVGASQGQPAIVNGYAVAGDGGGGVFYWDSDIDTTDDGGTLIVPGTRPRTGCWKRLYEGSLNVKWFGARGDAMTPDDAAIQAALHAMPAAGGELVIPAGGYRLNNTLIVNGLSDTILRGTGGVTLMWGGPVDVPMLLLRNAQYTTVSNLIFEAGNHNVSWESRARCAVESRSVNPARDEKIIGNPTFLKFADIRIDGHNGDSPGFDRGFRLRCDQDHDKNNDSFTFDHCVVFACAEAGFSIEHHQSRGHNFFNCNVNSCVNGISTALLGGDQTDDGGAFKWFGGAFGANSNADVLLGPPNEPIVITSVISESSNRFLRMTGSSASVWPVILDGIYWGTENPAVDGHDPDGADRTYCCILSHAGPITIRNCTWRWNRSNKTFGRVRIRYEPSTPTNVSAALRVEGCVFSTDTTTFNPLDIPTSLPNPIQSLISEGNILHVSQTAGTSMPAALPNQSASIDGMVETGVMRGSASLRPKDQNNQETLVPVGLLYLSTDTGVLQMHMGNNVWKTITLS